MMLNSEDYTVGWICAVTTEYVAARAVIEEQHERPKDVALDDTINYTLGRIGMHNVVMALLPREHSFSAGYFASCVKRNFPNIAFFLKVGIGSGAPSNRHDIRLGDIVVGSPLNGNPGGVRYYPKEGLEFTVFRTPAVLQPPAIPQTAVNELFVQNEINGQQLEQRINSILEKKPGLRRKYERPDPSSDNFYFARIAHRLSCDGPSIEWILRPERSEGEDHLAIHYGLIAWVDDSIRDASVRDRAAEEGFLSFDLAFGHVMGNFACLCIVGICDYARAGESKQWQGYAALTAAAYAIDLLYQIPPSKIEAEKSFGNVLSDQVDEASTTSATGSSSLTEEIFDSDRIHTFRNHSTGEEEAGKKSSDAIPTSRREVVFDSVEVMSVNDTTAAQSAADIWFTHQDKMGKVNRFFKQWRRNPTPKKQITKIAILDTGIDLDHPEFKPFRDNGAITGGCCRDFVSPGESPIRDSTGHGTHCAHLILKVCKTARLYVARVFETDVGDERAVERIPEAIDWAVQHKVDIIVMCFAFTKFHKTIYTAIRKATAEKDLLIFAAASNNKHDEANPVGFPAYMSDVIRVNSCTYQGIQSTFSPDGYSEGSCLSIIGEELQAAFPLAKNGNARLKRLSGTSMATAMLAGTAGLVLEFSRMEMKDGPNVREQDRLLMPQGMIAVLLNCMAGKKPPQPPRYCYIRPWLLFAPEVDRDTVVHRISDQLDNCMAQHL